jgi:hypothetical protein
VDRLSNHPEYDQQDNGNDYRYSNGPQNPETAREEYEHRDQAFLCEPRRSGRGVLRRPPLVPNVAEQGTVGGEVSGGEDGPVPHGVASLGPGTLERPVSRSPPDSEDERVGYGPYELPVAITVVVLVRRPGGGFGGGHGVSPLMGRHLTPPGSENELAPISAAYVNDRRMIQLSQRRG